MAVAERTVFIRDLSAEARTRRVEASIQLTNAALSSSLREVHDGIMHQDREIGTELLGTLTTIRSLKRKGKTMQGVIDFVAQSTVWALENAQRSGDVLPRLSSYRRNQALQTVENARDTELTNRAKAVLGIR